MEMSILILLQFFAHILADYFFQTQKMADSKGKFGFKSKWLVLHGILVFAIAWFLSFQLNYVLPALFIAITHYIIDGFKPWLSRNKYVGGYSYFIDQILHLAIILIIVNFYFKHFNFTPTIFIYDNLQIVVLLIAYLCCLKPANIFIKEMLRSTKIVVSNETDLPNGGKVIGNLERILTLTFILIGQFQAVGFLIAAKSILRYKDTDTLKTEYVLIGTMLSFGIALALGLAVPLLL